MLGLLVDFCAEECCSIASRDIAVLSIVSELWIACRAVSCSQMKLTVSPGNARCYTIGSISSA